MNPYYRRSEPISGASVGLCVKVSCNADRGASLFTKYRAKVERSPFPDVLKEHFIKHMYTWFSEAQKQRKPVKNLNDLILITGRVMTGDWATIAFSSRSQEHAASFNIKAVTVNASGTLWGRWSENVSLPKRHGPPRPTPIPDGEEPPSDQCIFIETFRAFDRPWYERLKTAITVKRKDGSRAKQLPKEKSISPTVKNELDFKLPSQDDDLADMPVNSIIHIYARGVQPLNLTGSGVCL